MGHEERIHYDWSRGTGQSNMRLLLVCQEVKIECKVSYIRIKTFFQHQLRTKTDRTRQNVENMGWLSWPWGSSSQNTTKTPDGGRIAPDRTSRQRCWESRDIFFSCLDDNDIVDSLKDDKEARRRCTAEIAAFEDACSKTWVGGVYFVCLRYIRIQQG